MTLQEHEAFHQWRMATGGYVCPQGENTKNASDDNARQLARRAALSDGEYTPYWVTMNVTPLGLCAPKSSTRRRKNLKKAAAIAAIAVGAVFLGPMVAGALKGAAAGVGVVGKVASATAKVIPKVVTGVNTVSTIKAIKEGKVPPPPIELTGTRFVDYAAAIGTNLVEREMQDQGQQVADAERRLIEERMAQQVRQLQQNAAGELPYRYPSTVLPSVSRDVRDAMAAPSDVWKFAAAGGAALVLALMFSR